MFPCHHTPCRRQIVLQDMQGTDCCTDARGIGSMLVRWAHHSPPGSGIWAGPLLQSELLTGKLPALGTCAHIPSSQRLTGYAALVMLLKKLCLWHLTKAPAYTHAQDSTQRRLAGHGEQRSKVLVDARQALLTPAWRLHPEVSTGVPCAQLHADQSL